MEADSTTIDQDSESLRIFNNEKENEVMEKLSENCEFFKQTMIPILQPDREVELLQWMKEFNLIASSVTCERESPDCVMKWVSSRVVDKFQWKCSTCNRKIQIRENSFFKNIFCSFSTTFKIILAWCKDMDYENVASIFHLKKKLVSTVYDKIERVIYKRPITQLGGPGSLLLVDLYPDFVDELYPVSSKSDTSPKSQHKILCFADTRTVPTNYWLHVITGNQFIHTENNNTTIKRWNLCEESSSILENISLPGGYCAIGGGAHFKTLRENLKSKNKFDGIITMNDLTARASDDIQSFLMKRIWGPIIKLCEAAQELPKNKMQSYLSCSLWRWQMESTDSFLSVINLIAEQDHTPTNNRPSSNKS